MNLLLVEDNPDDVQLTLRAFKKSNIGNEIIVARDGQEAIDYFFGEDGVAGKGRDLKRLRADERTKLVPIVILTSSREQVDMLSGYAHGCNSYIRKPVDFEQFADAVRQLGLYWFVLNEGPGRIHGP
jgi:two-component system response regulator